MLLDKVEISCKTGDVIGLYGKNGVGKSTLLKSVFGVLKTDCLTVHIDGKFISRNKIVGSNRIAYLPQEPFLPKSLRVRDLIPMCLTRLEDQEKVFYAPKVSSFDMEKVGNLSAGQFRYLEILLIANLDHDFLLLDEPFSMLEPSMKVIVKDKILEWSATKGIILTDHYYEDVMEISNTGVLLDRGNLAKVDDIEDLKKLGYVRR
ncbi:hypothetical protein BST97_11285 [Nonlabens spongiae]|uniref:ABC transporter domain-containing protein n=1 Tax=Nonlabens spongiae TaxID=331648 RepID=A0A1W6MLQ2_9FLAO|nr:hypothetical protein BST97_11285 [Nonlabens spongiae]